VLHNLGIVNVNGGDSTSQYYTPLAVARFTGRREKIRSGYFIATSHILRLQKHKNSEH
jgi:hypothetical protein